MTRNIIGAAIYSHIRQTYPKVKTSFNENNVYFRIIIDIDRVVSIAISFYQDMVIMTDIGMLSDDIAEFDYLDPQLLDRIDAILKQRVKEGVKEKHKSTPKKSI